MAEDTIASSVEVVDTDVVEKKDVLAPLVAKEMWEDTIGESTFLTLLNKDMPIEKRREAIRLVAKQAVSAGDKLDLMTGEALFEASENNYWKTWTFFDGESKSDRAYASFDEYVDKELGIGRRKAYYLISIYKKFVIDLALPKDRLKELEWSKAKELIPIINSGNWADLLEKIAGMTVKQVIEYVKGIRASGGTTAAAPSEGGESAGGGAAEKTKVVTMKFNLTPAQAENVDKALEMAKAMSSSDKTGNLLDLICADFNAGAIGSEPAKGILDKLDFHLGNIQRTFGVKLNVESVDSSVVSGH